MHESSKFCGELSEVLLIYHKCLL